MDTDADPTGPLRPPAPAARHRRSRDPERLLEEARAGDRAAVGRLLSIVERGGPDARRLGRLVFPDSGAVDQVIGITGPPGAGKSTLTAALVGHARAGGGRVAVLAVDPSSPFSGGAILGDRIRMQAHALDDRVFIRSMATRGHQGGLALAVPEAVRLLVASGLPLVIVETVGVGQVEVDIAGAADTTIVVLTPGWGDAVQANKAGLLEVADIFVINKADRPGAAETRRDLENMLDLSPSARDWRPPIVAATATSGEGTEELWMAVREHRSYLEGAGELTRRRDRRLTEELTRVLIGRLERDVKALEGGAVFDEVRAEMLARRIDPYDAAERLLAG